MKKQILTLAFTLASAGLLRADLMQPISIDTTSLNGQAGYLDLQFNPDGPTAAAAAASLLNVSTDAAGISNNFQSASVTGSFLSDTLAIGNSPISGSNPANEDTENVTFGNDIAFTLDFSGPALTPGPGVVDGSTFSISLYDLNGNSLLASTGPVEQVTLTPEGLLNTTIYTPEPAVFGLIGLGVAALVFARRKRIA